MPHEYTRFLPAGFVASNFLVAENLLKPHEKKINSLRSNSIFFSCNANFHPLSYSDTPADAPKYRPIQAGQAFDPTVLEGCRLRGGVGEKGCRLRESRLRECVG